MKHRHDPTRWGILVASVLMFVLVAAACETQEPVDPETQEINDAITSNLPIEEGEFELVEVDDGPIVENLEALRAGTVQAPLRIELPVLNADGSVGSKVWTAYHVNLRSPELLPSVDSSDVRVPDEQIAATSRTFRGFPEWTDNDFLATLAQFESNPPEQFDESELQPSVLNLIGNDIEGAYFGNPDDPTVPVITSIQNLLEPHVGIDEAARLGGLTNDNYVIYHQEDLQPIVNHGELEAPPVLATEDTAASESITTQEHVQIRTVHPAMVADDTLYDPDTNTWLINHWFDRVDAAANRQDAYMWLANIARDIPGSASSLADDNNRIYVRTEIARYLVLTESGKAALNDPGTLCSSGGYLNEVRQLSNNFEGFSNEYWMWWTKRYGGGCAYISTIHRTPRDYAVGVTGYGSGNIDSTSFVFMHESGHTLGGTHQTNAAGSPETLPSHRCDFLGFIPVGPTGPSLMSYASGSRTYCFAETDPNDPTPKKNLTQVAEFLHTNLQP